MLITISAPGRSARREANEGRKVDVFVHAVDVGVRVVNDVVGDLPDVTVGADEIEAQAKQVVDIGVVGVRAVECVVRHGEPDAGDADAEDNRQAEHGERRESIRHDGGVRAHDHAEQEKGLQPHGPVPLGGSPAGFEIGRDTGFDIADEGRRFPAGKGDGGGIELRHWGGSCRRVNSILTTVPSREIGVSADRRRTTIRRSGPPA